MVQLKVNKKKHEVPDKLDFPFSKFQPQRSTSRGGLDLGFLDSQSRLHGFYSILQYLASGTTPCAPLRQSCAGFWLSCRSSLLITLILPLRLSCDYSIPNGLNPLWSEENIDH